MCLAIPGKIISIKDEKDAAFRIGRVSFDGTIQEVNLAMVPEAVIGDYVLVHVGLALNVVDEEEAKKTLEYFKDMEDKGLLGSPDQTTT